MDLSHLPPASFLATWLRFGYAIAEPEEISWRFTIKDHRGMSFANGRVANRQVHCP